MVSFAYHYHFNLVGNFHVSYILPKLTVRFLLLSSFSAGCSVSIFMLLFFLCMCERVYYVPHNTYCMLRQITEMVKDELDSFISRSGIYYSVRAT